MIAIISNYRKTFKDKNLCALRCQLCLNYDIL